MQISDEAADASVSAPGAWRRWVVLAAVTAWCVYWFAHSWGYWEDDAWIHLEFARSFAAGQGFAFNGHVVAGDTAPAWVFLLAGMHNFISNWLLAGKALTVAGAIFGFTGIYAYARRLAAEAPDRALAAIFPAAVVLLIAVNPYTCYWIFSGMEPLTAAGWACLAMLTATQARPTTATFLTACAMAGLAPLLRPEMMFLSLLLALPLFGQWRALRPSGGAATLLAGVLLSALPFTLWSLYSLHAFGHLLPNTNAAKRAGPDDSVAVHLLSAYALGFPLILAGAVGGAMLVATRFARARRSLAAAIAAALAPGERRGRGLAPEAWLAILWPAINGVFYVLNHTYVQTRYIFVPAAALTAVLLACALRYSRHAAAAAYALALAAALVVSVAMTWPLIRNKDIDVAATSTMANYIRTALPPQAAVAVYGIGEIAFLSQHPIVDTGGITRPGAIAYLNRPIGEMAGWAQREGASYWIGDRPQPDATLVFSVDLRPLGWTFHRKQYDERTPLQLWKLTRAGATP